jgi:alcohol dehydrogenase class IV
MTFEFATSGQIIFGREAVKKVASLASAMGNMVFIVSGSSDRSSSLLMESLKSEGLKVVIYKVTGEPTIKSVMDGVNIARKSLCNVVIGIGGGSVLDTGKVIAALLTNKGDLIEYLEVIGQSRSLKEISFPFIAIPTTSGTGAEVTKNAVIRSLEHSIKVSIRNPWMIPRIAVVDPLLTRTMPPMITASTGLDALTQLIEAYVSRKSNPLTDPICCEGIKRVARSLKKAYEDGNDFQAREDMAVASLFSGLALANAGLGAVHGIAGPMGGMFEIPHGIACALLLPNVMEINIEVIRLRMPESSTLRRYYDIAKILTGKSNVKEEDGAYWVKNLCGDFNIPKLSNFGITDKALTDLPEKARIASSMKGNPVPLSDNEILKILDMTK